MNGVYSCIGIRNVDFKGSDGNQVTGVNLYLTYEDPQIQGFGCEKVFVNVKTFTELSYVPEVGSPCILMIPSHAWNYQSFIGADWSEPLSSHEYYEFGAVANSYSLMTADVAAVSDSNTLSNWGHSVDNIRAGVSQQAYYPGVSVGTVTIPGYWILRTGTAVEILNSGYTSSAWGNVGLMYSQPVTVPGLSSDDTYTRFEDPAVNFNSTITTFSIPVDGNSTAVFRLIYDSFTFSIDVGEKPFRQSVVTGISNIFQGIIELPGKIVNLLIDGLKSLFIPGEDELTSIQGKYQQLLSERLGFIWQAYELINNLFTGIMDALESGGVYEFSFPGIAFPFNGEELVILPETSVSLENEVMDVIRPVLGTIVCFIAVVGFINVSEGMVMALISGVSYYEFLHGKKGGSG